MKKQLKLSDFYKDLPINIQKGIWQGHVKDLVTGRYGRTFDFDVHLPSKGICLQRPFVWTLHQKQQLILSILKQNHIQNPTVVIYESEDHKKTYKVIDGKQRLNAMITFCQDGFPLNVDGEDYLYSELPKEVQRVIDMHDVYFDVAYEYFDDMIPDEVKINWFERINFLGTVQDIEHLNRLRS